MSENINLQNIKIVNKTTERYNYPVVFYLCGSSESGKSKFVTELFGDKLYYKPKKAKLEPDYWTGYNGQEFVLFDEYNTKIYWTSLVYLLNDEKTFIEINPNESISFLTKYIFITDNELLDRRNYTGQFLYTHLNYIIEFTGEWNDNIKRRTTKMIFHKVHNKNIDGHIVMNNRKVYFRQDFPDYMKKYLLDFPNSKSLFEYKNKEEQKEFLKSIIIKLENYSDLQKMCFFEKNDEILNLDDFYYEQDGNSCSPRITMTIKERKWFLIDNDLTYNFYYKNQKFLKLKPRQYEISHCGINRTNNYIFFMCENKKIQNIPNSYTCEFNRKSLEKKIVNGIECFEIIDTGVYIIYRDSTVYDRLIIAEIRTYYHNEDDDIENFTISYI
ncbi:21481_t:CDS:2 [Cetraspora pellucida]|uniref:21481_t:CDS:1 n=1 Tax=Cetraspora pellucida TaxID=1433469 RepID=A0A9N9K1P2_9GLOM|nr:21481_t:CDS:2 [Cetraspora pellucida]